jgi:hypothetical protein
MRSYDDDIMSFYSDDDEWNTYDPTICACSGVGERPVEECGRCLEYYTWHAAAREVSAMDAPTIHSIAIAEIRLLISKWTGTPTHDEKVQVALALLLCMERYPDTMAVHPNMRETMLDRCNGWAESAPELRAACDHCREFLGSLRSRPDYVWSQQEDEEAEAARMGEGDDDWAISTAERLTVDQ